MSGKIQLKPVFVKTKNVRNFEVMMDGLALNAGEGCLGMVYGQAGRGKTRTSQWYAANNSCVYLRIATIWSTSELDFMKSLCKELEILTPPSRKGACYTAIVDILLDSPRTIFLDEIEKLPKKFLDLIRDLSDMGMCPFVLIGEEELVSYMKQNKRVWSRTFQQLEFKPIEVPDILIYAKESTGLKLEDPKVAAIYHSGSGGDFRLVKRAMLETVKIASAKGVDGIDSEMAKMAVKAGLIGR